MEQRIIIVCSLNLTPEDELEKRFQELGEGWRVVSATTSLALQGSMNYRTETSWMDGIARHVYYVTTAIVERKL